MSSFDENTNTSAVFEGLEVHEEQYNFLKDRLNSYELYINSKYSFKSEIQYDKSLELLSVKINIMIPNHCMPNACDKTNEIIMDPIHTFQMVYDVQNELYNRNHRHIVRHMSRRTHS